MLLNGFLKKQVEGSDTIQQALENEQNILPVPVDLFKTHCEIEGRVSMLNSMLLMEIDILKLYLVRSRKVTTFITAF